MRHLVFTQAASEANSSVMTAFKVQTWDKMLLFVWN